MASWPYITITKTIARNLHFLFKLIHNSILFTDTQCPAPNLNATYVVINNPPAKGFVVGFTVLIGCVAGYSNIGTFLTTCQEDRSWSVAALPTCTSKVIEVFLVTQIGSLIHVLILILCICNHGIYDKEHNNGESCADTI